MPEGGEVKRLRARLAKQEKENERLRRVIKLMAASESSDEDEDDMAVDAPDYDEGHEEEGSVTGGGDEEAPKAMWDESDYVYRCVDCWGEIDDGSCFECLTEHVIENENPDYNSIPASNSQAFSVDRVLAPRSTTPLLDLPTSDVVVPLLYNDPGNTHRPAISRSAEYIELRQRGATRAMCEEFSLEFTQKRGIVAWVNQDIMDEFGDPAMQEGDKWKIYLGRRVQLDEDDTDGTFFIEGILEDGTLFAPKHETRRWVTMKELGTMWATKPNEALEASLRPQEAEEEDEDGDGDGDDDDDEDDDEDGDEDGDEGEDAVDLGYPLRNAYDLEDDEEEPDATPEDEEEEPDVKEEDEEEQGPGLEDGEEEEETARLSGAHPKGALGLSIADIDDSDMEWEQESSNGSSCDSDFYSD